MGESIISTDLYRAMYLYQSTIERLRDLHLLVHTLSAKRTNSARPKLGSQDPVWSPTWWEEPKYWCHHQLLLSSA